MWSLLFSVNHVSVSVAISMPLRSRTASISVVLSVFAELPKLWILDSKNFGRHLGRFLVLFLVLIAIAELIWFREVRVSGPFTVVWWTGFVLPMCWNVLAVGNIGLVSGR